MQQRRHDTAVEAGARHAVKQQQVDGLIRKANRAEPAGVSWAAAREEGLVFVVVLRCWLGHCVDPAGPP